MDILCRMKWGLEKNWLGSILNGIEYSRKVYIGENKVYFSLKGIEFIKI